MNSGGDAGRQRGRQGLPFEILLAWRYLRAQTDNGFLSFISVIGIVGIAIGVAVLVVVLSVMNGFEEELRARILDVTPHATLAETEAGIGDWRPMLATIERAPGVAGAAPYVESQSLLVAGQQVSGAEIYGIDPAQESHVSNLGRKLSAGTLDALSPGSFRVALGRALAAELKVGIGDRVMLFTPQGTSSPAGLIPRTRRLTVAAIFDSGMYEYDRNVAFINLADAARLYRLNDAISGFRLKVEDPFAAPRVVREVAIGLGPDAQGQPREWYVRDWTRAHANFFQSVATTKGIMFAILLLVTAVASFNVVSTLVMLVREKRHDIGILRTYGVSPRSLMLTFVALGTAIGLLGVLSGILLGWAVAANITGIVRVLEHLLGVHLIDAKVYFIDELPSRVRLADVGRIGVTAFVLACLSTLLPASWAARTQPAEALRHDQ